MGDTFAHRIAVATPHEEDVKRLMGALGWDCEKYGQGMQTERVRKILRLINSNSRWLPDLVAHNRDDGRGMWIDAKSGMGIDYPNYSLEIRAFESFAKWHEFDARRSTCIYVWGDLHWCSVDTISAGIDAKTVTVGGRARFGSGTPYYLVPKKPPFRSRRSLHEIAQVRQPSQKALAS
jgi:hypothetical protein